MITARYNMNGFVRNFERRLVFTAFPLSSITYEYNICYVCTVYICLCVRGMCGVCSYVWVCVLFIQFLIYWLLEFLPSRFIFVFLSYLFSVFLFVLVFNFLVWLKFEILSTRLNTSAIRRAFMPKKKKTSRRFQEIIDLTCQHKKYTFSFERTIKR